MACKSSVKSESKSNLKSEKSYSRKSGILLHITSLPGSEGIGTLGKEAFKFCDWLNKAGQTLWQVLPLGPTGYGDSPYASFSTFAGNPLLIDLSNLASRNWASKKDIKKPDFVKAEGPVDYGAVVYWKMPVLYKCADYFLANASIEDKKLFETFKKQNKKWLDDFALYTSIKKFYDNKAASENVCGEKSKWNNFWPKALASHEESALKKWTKENKVELEQIKAIQFFFFTQWNELKSYANSKNIKIIGDIPIFVAGDSTDLWANQNLFQMNKKTLQQKAVAGVPPDYFSATGQLWGNPLYDWKAIKETGYEWWINRIKQMMKLVDIVRIDHFRGFEAYWKIPAGEETAINGKWTKGPGIELFDAIKKSAKNAEIIAEDLGVITPKVAALRDKAQFPGMKILQFAFNDQKWSEESAANLYLPENFETENCVVYTGTHDNDTTMGLLSYAKPQLKTNIKNYLKLESNSDDKKILLAMIEAAFNSKAKYCILPLQDVYAVGSEGRMNTPSTSCSNWSWRMDKKLLDSEGAALLKKLSKSSGRNL